MSYQATDGTCAEMPRTVAERNRFLAQIHRDWSGTDRGKLRGLAALTLYAEGWTLEMISGALGWKERTSARKAIRRTCQALREHFAHMHPGANVGDDGFSDPDEG